MLREQIIRSNEERDGDGLESSKMDNINKINMNKDSLLYSCPALYHCTVQQCTDRVSWFRSNLSRAQMDGWMDGWMGAKDASE